MTEDRCFLVTAVDKNRKKCKILYKLKHECFVHNSVYNNKTIAVFFSFLRIKKMNYQKEKEQENTALSVKGRIHLTGLFLFLFYRLFILN